MNLPFDILNPWVFLGLFLIAFLVHWCRKSVDSLTVGRRMIAVSVRIVIFVLIIFALADIRWQAPSDKRAVTYLVDVSRSVGNNGIEKLQEYMGKRGENRLFDYESWIAFAGKPENQSGPKSFDTDDPDNSEQVRPSSLDDRKTDLSGALRFAQASFPPGYLKTIVVFSDGRSTGNWTDEAKALQQAGVQVHSVRVEPPERSEALVKSVKTPLRVKEDEPFRVDTEIISNRETGAQLKVFRKGALVSSERVQLTPGINRFHFDQSIRGDKLTEFTVEIEADGDHVVDNNQMTSLVHTMGKSKALILSDRVAHSRYLALALKQEGILLDIRPAVGAPSDMADLQNYDLLMIDNVPATNLRPNQLNLISAYVKDFGGGFMMLGGDKSFGLGGYYRTAIETILPVKCDFEKEKENPSLGLVLIIDKSGSMGGMKMEMAKEAAKAAVELLSPNDYAGVIVFDGQAFWAAELQPLIDKFGLVQLISTIQAGGGTTMAPAMELAYSQLSITPARLKHVIILTDGQSSPGPFQELTMQMVQERITVSTVGVGNSIDQPLLEQIARWGNGRFYYTDEAQSIPQIFAKETMTASKSAIKELPFQPQVVRDAPFLPEIDYDTIPFLYGYVVTEAKPTAEVWLGTERGEPLLATWRYGLGNVGAFTSDARNRWAVEWLRWRGFGPFWAQICRKLMRSSSLTPYPVSFDAEPGMQRMNIETVDAQGHFITGLKGRALIVPPEGPPREVPLESGLPGSLTAAIDTPMQGNYHIDIVLQDEDGNIVNRQYATATVGYPDEFLLQPADVPMLQKLARVTEGIYNPSWEDIVAENGRTATHEYELWPWLLAAALAVFMIDVAAKRWPN